ncbi:MAG: hypothetical protein KC900_01435 [Candidatus Omnitrophica bacterium]|nr:hypothetical protein [Candidatus Omnitrophota bacterium]
MDNSSLDSIREYGNKPNFSLEELDDAFVLSFSKNDLVFKITVAYSALEWFLEIERPESELKFSDWCDYLGYDDRPESVLEAEMVDHLHRLITALQNHQFRLKKGKNFLNPGDNCECLVNNKWVKFDYGKT